MDSVILQIGSNVVRAFRIREARGEMSGVDAGPLLRTSGPLAAGDPGVWLEIVEPLRAFFRDECRGVRKLIVLPTEAEVNLYRVRAVPHTAKKDLLQARLDLADDREGNDPGSWDVWWTFYAQTREEGVEWLDFSTVRVDAALARRLRELPEALGLRTGEPEIVPYPVAAARALRAAAGPDNAARTVALLDIGFYQSFFSIHRAGVPLFCTAVDFSGSAIQKVLTTPVAFLDGDTKALSPAEAAQLMGRLNVAALDDEITRESSPTRRQILQAVGIIVEEAVRSVSAIWRTAWEKAGLQGDRGHSAVAYVYTENTITGMEALLEDAAGATWHALPPRFIGNVAGNSPEAVFMPAVPIAISGVAAARRGDDPKWERLADETDSGSRWWRFSQWAAMAVILLLLGAWGGAGVTTFWVRAAVARLEAGDHSKDAAERKAFLDQAKLRRQAALRRARLLRDLVLDDVLCRRFLWALAAFHRPNFVVESLVFGGGERAAQAPETVIVGRAGAADRQLKDFIRFLDDLPFVKDVVLDSVAQVDVRDQSELGCRFQLRVLFTAPDTKTKTKRTKGK